MIYIYDVLLNFQDLKRIPEFYEWNNNDEVEHIKRIPLFRVNKETIDDLLNYDIKFSNDLLQKIKNKTIDYNKRTLPYLTLLSDTNKVIALELSNNGNIISRSYLLLDEEDDIAGETKCLKEEPIQYKKLNKYKIDYFLTREELFRKNYLEKELKNLYKNKDFNKISYLYMEYYNDTNYDIDYKYHKLMGDLKLNYNEKHNELYEIVRLTYMKK